MADQKKRRNSGRANSRRSASTRSLPQRTRKSVGEKDGQRNETTTSETGSTEYEEIVKVIPQLTDEQIQNVVAACQYEQNRRDEKKGNDVIDNADLKPFYDALIEATKDFGSALRKNNFYFWVSNTKNRDVRKLSSAKIELDKWVNKNIGGLRRSEKYWFYKFAWSCLLTMLRDNNEQAGFSSAIRNNDRIPEAIDWCLPGYMQNGLIKHIIKQRSHTKLKRGENESTE